MRLITFLFVLLTLAACKEETGDAPGVVLPTNLTLSIDDSNSSSGLVILTYAADGANFYTLDFGDGSDVLQTNDTDFTHKYNADGTYEITVNAHTTTTDFITIKESVAIEIDAASTDDGYTTPLSYDDYTLVWNDEFEGTSLNTDDWNYEIGNGCPSLCGWGNNELQYYQEENTTVADGYLIITAKEEFQDGFDYTSSRLTTQGKRSFKYGRIDIRAKLPKGQGLWPALWMLGDNISSVGWPSCGEIDIMELIGGPATNDEVHGTLHWDNNGSYACTCGQGEYILNEGIFNDKFHVFTIIWDQNTIEWYVDDEPMRRSGGAPFETSISSAAMSEFQNEFFFIFNVAVGGNWPGSPDGTTTFPQRMLVDYVRVFQ